jgi:hypothetical protein
VHLLVWKKTVQNARYVHQNTKNIIFVVLVIFLGLCCKYWDITTSGVTKSVEELLKQGKHIPMSMTMTSFVALSRIVLLWTEAHDNCYVWITFVIFLPITGSNFPMSLSCTDNKRHRNVRSPSIFYNGYNNGQFTCLKVIIKWIGNDIATRLGI